MNTPHLDKLIERAAGPYVIPFDAQHARFALFAANALPEVIKMLRWLASEFRGIKQYHVPKSQTWHRRRALIVEDVLAALESRAKEVGDG